ncbi:MAG: hypothetical protein GY950_10210, partial [bacterium]|nr:hypothetical protein [bacterium]
MNNLPFTFGRLSEPGLRRKIQNRVFLLLFIFTAVRLAAIERPKLFKLSSFSGALNLQYQLTDEQEGSAGLVSRDVGRRFLEGGIMLNTAGSIYHPNLL